MSEEDFDPSAVPLPMTEDTIYLRSGGTIRENEFHSNAFDSDEEKGEDYTSDEYEDNDNTLMALPSPRENNNHAGLVSPINMEIPAHIDEDHEMSDPAHEEHDQSENAKESEQDEDEELEDTLPPRRYGGGKVRNFRESNGSMIHYEETRPSTESELSDDYNSEVEQEDEHADLDKTLAPNMFKLPEPPIMHDSTPARTLFKSSVAHNPSSSVFSTPEGTPQQSSIPLFNHTNLKTPYLSRGTPSGRLSLASQADPEFERDLLLATVKDREAHIKYLESLIETSADAGEILDEFVSFSPEKKRVKITATPRPNGDGNTPLTVTKKRNQNLGLTPVGATTLFPDSPVPQSVRQSSRAVSRSPVKAFNGLFDTIIGTPSPAKEYTAVIPPMTVKTAKERKADKRRRLTREFREFSAVNLNELKSFLPPAAVVEEEEDDSGDKAKSEDAPMEVDNKNKMDDDNKAEEVKSEPVAESPTKAKDATPEPSKERKPIDMSIFNQLSTIKHKRRHSDYGGPRKAEAEQAEDAADEVQDKITSFHDRIVFLEQELEKAMAHIAYLQHERDTSDAAAMMAHRELLGERRARKQAEEVRDFLEREKEFGLCCKHAQEANQKKAQSQESLRLNKQQPTKSSTAAAYQSIPTAATTTRKRTRDQIENSGVTGLPTRGNAAARLAAANQPPPEKKPLTATVGNSLITGRPTRASAKAQQPDLGLAKKPSKAALNAPTLDKPAVRGAARPRSRMAMADGGENVNRYATRGSTAAAERPSSRMGRADPDARYGGRLASTTTTKAGERPASRFGDRNDGGVFGRLAGTGARVTKR